MLLVTVGFVTAAVPSGAYHLDLDVVHREEVDRPGAYGASVDLAEPGDLEFVLNGYGQTLSTPISHGVAIFDEEDGYVGMIVVTAHFSPDRVHLRVSPAGSVISNHDGAGLDIRTDGDLAGMAGTELTLETTSDPGGQAASEEPTIRTFAALHGRQAGTHEAIVWLGEAERTELEVQTDAEVEAVRTQAGTAHVAGDQDLDQATLDAQVQNSFVAGSLPLEDTQSLGAKAMYDASKQVTVGQELHGVWALAERKGTCLEPDLCLEPAVASNVCAEELELACGLASISWSNGTHHEELRRGYAYNGADAGNYTFSVDWKLDAYEAGWESIQWEENHSFLSVADVSLPG